jgi:hypothetical protein
MNEIEPEGDVLRKIVFFLIVVLVISAFLTGCGGVVPVSDQNDQGNGLTGLGNADSRQGDGVVVPPSKGAAGEKPEDLDNKQPYGYKDVNAGGTTAAPTDYGDPVHITLPVMLDDPEINLVDYFRSVGFDASLLRTDDNIVIYGEKGLSLIFDLGDGMTFYADVLKRKKEGTVKWELTSSSFGNPKGRLLAGLIEDSLDAIAAMKGSDESDWNKQAFRDNTLSYFEKYGTPALDYMLAQFEKGRGKGEKGMLMAEACSRILGSADNVPAGWKSGEEWYSQLKPLQVVALPPVSRPAGNMPEELATTASLKRYSAHESGGIVLVALHVFDSYEKDKILTIWATVLEQQYVLYEKKLVENGGGIIPAAIKFKKGADGSYTLEKYIEAKDGSAFAPSIREFCKPKKGVADKILKHYGEYGDLFVKMNENLTKYLKDNNLTGIILEDHTGKQVKHSLLYNFSY